MNTNWQGNRLYYFSYIFPFGGLRTIFQKKDKEIKVTLVLSTSYFENNRPAIFSLLVIKIIISSYGPSHDFRPSHYTTISHSFSFLTSLSLFLSPSSSISPSSSTYLSISVSQSFSLSNPSSSLLVFLFSFISFYSYSLASPLALYASPFLSLSPLIRRRLSLILFDHIVPHYKIL